MIWIRHRSAGSGLEEASGIGHRPFLIHLSPQAGRGEDLSARSGSPRSEVRGLLSERHWVQNTSARPPNASSLLSDTVTVPAWEDAANIRRALRRRRRSLEAVAGDRGKSTWRPTTVPNLTTDGGPTLAFSTPAPRFRVALRTRRWAQLVARASWRANGCKASSASTATRSTAMSTGVTLPATVVVGNVTPV